MQAVLVQELRWQQGAAGGGTGAPDPSAVAAKQAYLTVHAAVATHQLQLVLCEGSIPLDPPCPAFGEAEVRRAEVREQAQIALGASQRMNCTVCFTRGQERQAYFAVEGLPAHVKAGLAPDLSLLKPSVLQQVACAAPVCLVADPGTQPQTGLVLSVAPLMGAVPAVDARHTRWLHVQVRPPLRGLLKVLAASHPGNALLNIQKHLISGHWVLSFPDGDCAASAAQHVEEWAHKMRAVYCQLLSPLLHATADPAGGSGSDCGNALRPAAGEAQQAGSGSDCGSAREAAVAGITSAGEDYSV
jgi:protein CLEC16A